MGIKPLPQCFVIFFFGHFYFFLEIQYILEPAEPGASYGYINLTRDGGGGLVCSSKMSDSEANSLCLAAGFKYGGQVLTQAIAGKSKPFSNVSSKLKDCMLNTTDG